MTLEEFNEELKNINMSKKEFSDLLDVSYSTVSGYGTKNKGVPHWIPLIIEGIKNKKKLTNIKKALKDVDF